VILPSHALMPVVRDALARGQRVRMTVTGSSMWPLLCNNDAVELEPAPPPRRGDVVLVRTSLPGTADRYALHRVVRIDGDATFFVRGDAQSRSEGPFAPEALLGRVTTSWHKGCPRDQLRGRWRLAGTVWVRCSLFGLSPGWVGVRVRDVGGRIARGLQRAPACRAYLKRFRPPYVIREASQGDLVALGAWLLPNSSDSLPVSGRNTHPNVTTYVARHRDQLLGLVILMRHPETGLSRTGHWLYSLTVRTQYRGMGLGEALTERIIHQSRLEGAADLCLNVFENNAPALALYRKLGFEPVVFPALEPELAADVEKYGRRRVTLRKTLT
jgi:GNAT superfamily N-acetyltransferase